MPNPAPFILPQYTPMLQSTLATSSAGGDQVYPHHPITCTGVLRYNDDDSFECDHTKVTAEDVRTKQCITHSIAIMIIEEAVRRFG